MRTQTDRVLAVLRTRGTEGTYQGEWYGDAPDGLGPITRLTSRIDDLKNQGHQIEVRPKTTSRKFVTYILRAEAPAQKPQAAEPEPPGFDPDMARDAIIEAAHLFDPPEAEAMTPGERYYREGL